MGLLPLEMSARIRAGDLDGAVELRPRRLHRLRLLRLRLPVAHSAGAVLQPRQGRTLGHASAPSCATKRPSAWSQHAPNACEREAKEKAEAAARRKAERAAQKAKAAAEAAADSASTARRRNGMSPPPSTPPVAVAAHARRRNSVSRVMVTVMLALVPATLFGFWLYGWPSICLLLITVGAAAARRSASACA